MIFLSKDFIYLKLFVLVGCFHQKFHHFSKSFLLLLNRILSYVKLSKYPTQKDFLKTFLTLNQKLLVTYEVYLYKKYFSHQDKMKLKRFWLSLHQERLFLYPKLFFHIFLFLQIFFLKTHHFK